MKEENERLDFSEFDKVQITDRLGNIISTQDVLLRGILERHNEQRQHTRVQQNRGELPHFTVGDYVLLARVRKEGRNAKRMTTWTGP